MYYSELSLSIRHYVHRSSGSVEMELASATGLNDNDIAFFQKASSVGVLKYVIH